MPHYFFHRTDGYVERDRIGTELGGLSEVRLHALVFAGETLKDDPGRVREGQDMYVEVTDANDDVVFTVRIECFTATTKTSNV